VVDVCCVLQLLESSIVAVTRIGKKSETSRALDGDDDIDEDDTELFTVCSEIAAEEELLALVHEALTLWESCFQADSEQKKSIVFCDRTVDWTVSIDYIEVLVMVYKLMEVSILCVTHFCFTAALLNFLRLPNLECLDKFYYCSDVVQLTTS